jgi:hypothetical protein
MKVLLARLLAVGFGIVLRLQYAALPPAYQLALSGVRITPFSDRTLGAKALWDDTSAYIPVTGPNVVETVQVASVKFHMTTYGWWGGQIGFRSPPPQDNRVQATALGDSFTFCFTEVDDCWVSVLSNATGVPIANLGQPGTGSISHAQLYETFIARAELHLRQPKLVIWQFFGNDYNDDYGAGLSTNSTRPAQAPLVRWFKENSALYVIINTLQQAKDPAALQFVDPYHVQAGSIDLYFGRTGIRDSFDMENPHNIEGEVLSQQAMVQTRDTVEKNGGQFMVIIIPPKEEVYRSLTEPVMGKAAVDSLDASRLRLLAFCQAHHMKCLDLLPELQKQADHQLYYPADIHLNAAGNRVVAVAICDFLRIQGLDQCAK